MVILFVLVWYKFFYTLLFFHELNVILITRNIFFIYRYLFVNLTFNYVYLLSKVTDDILQTLPVQRLSSKGS